MAWTNGFHNSVQGDRLYNADQMSGIFDGLITQGVYMSIGKRLAVEPNDGMTIQINTGRGWFNSRWVCNTSPYLLELEASDVLLNRWAAVCVRGDNTDGVRNTVPYVKYGEFATEPTKPTMERTERIKEYCLAYVYIAAGKTKITAADIEDTRANTDLCGWVTGLIKQIDADTLFQQFEALFNEWFEGLKDNINEDTEVVLVNALPESTTITLKPEDWADNRLEMVIAGLTETKKVFVTANDETISQYDTANVRIESHTGGRLIFVADEKPTENIKVDIMHLGK